MLEHSKLRIMQMDICEIISQKFVLPSWCIVERVVIIVDLPAILQ